MKISKKFNEIKLHFFQENMIAVVCGCHVAQMSTKVNAYLCRIIHYLSSPVVVGQH